MSNSNIKSNSQKTQENKINYTKRYKDGLDWLNTNQMKAVETVYGPVMVVAGPGTGKTQILALRTAYLLYEGICNPENILISTFTDAGVIALRERLAHFIGSDAYKITVSTIHSFAQDVIRNFPVKFVEYKAQDPIDEIGTIELIKEILFKAIDDKKLEKLTSVYDKEYYLRAIKSNISILKREGINSKNFKSGIKEQASFYKEELDSLKENKRIRDLAKRTEKDKKTYDLHITKLTELNYIYKRYQEELRERGLYDFDDMIIYVLEIFKSDEELRTYYAEKYQFIMLDEFQDTNNAQNLIISEILKESIDTPNIFVVGDDDQSIYRFQGANIENIMKFAHNFKEVKTIVMEENYRSSQNILDTAQSLINNNEERLVNRLKNLNKNLVASGLNKKFNNPVKFGITNNEITEKYSVLQEIKTLRGKSPLPEREGQSDKIYSEIAIIVKSNQEVKDWSEYLQNNEIPVNSKSQSDTFNNSYVKLIIKFFRIIINPRGDERSMYDVIRSSISGVNGNDFLKISRFLFNKNYTRKDALKIADILSNANLLTNVITPSERDLKDFGTEFYKWNNLDGIKTFWQNILDLQEILAEKSVSEFFDIFLKKFNLVEYIQENEGFEVLEDVYDFFDFVKTSNKNNLSLRLEDLLDRIDLYKKYKISRKRTQILEKPYGVNIVTGHSSKGLEWDTVFIPGCYLGGWDNTRSRDLIKLPSSLFSEFQLDDNENKKEKALEEARRLFFVAITRARKNLLLTLPAERNASATVKSMFIEELSGNIEEITLKVPKNELQEEIIKLITHKIEVPNDSEFAYINNFFKNYKLSPSDLNLFLEDPREFLFRVILKYPFIPNEFTIFGNVYHRVLELFYLKYKKEDKIPESSYLTNTFKILLSREILTHSEYERLLEKGIDGLEGWYKTYSANTSIPLDLEYNFRSKNVVFEGVPITGKIDKIDLSNSLSSGTAGGALFTEGVVLVDYKTGKPKTLNTIKGLTKAGNKNYFRQLLFYKLLAENDKDFSSKFIVDSLAIDFVEGKDGIYKYISIDYSPEDYEELKQEIIDSWEKMQDESFWREILRK